MKAKFITLEGIDGAGKSTHLEWLSDYIRGLGHALVVTREPGGTPLGERLRELLLSQPMHPETETLLMFAARREHLDKVILPALANGSWVISDRFTDASFAYQSGGRGVPEAKVAALEAWVQEGLQPDLTLLFDVPPEVSRQRLAAMQQEPDRFEREREAFFAAVRAMYLQRAAASGGRVRVIDAARPLADVRKALEEIAAATLS